MISLAVTLLPSIDIGVDIDVFCVVSRIVQTPEVVLRGISTIDCTDVDPLLDNLVLNLARV